MEKFESKFLRMPCGGIVTVLTPGKHEGECIKVEGVTKITANTSDGAKEKHVPVVDINNGIVKVNIGAVEHPMTEEHYIEWILVETCCGSYIRRLSPTSKPEATFNIGDEKVLRVYEYCNLHGLWLYEVK